MDGYVFVLYYFSLLKYSHIEIRHILLSFCFCREHLIHPHTNMSCCWLCSWTVSDMNVFDSWWWWCGFCKFQLFESMVWCFLIELLYLIDVCLVLEQLVFLDQFKYTTLFFFQVHYPILLVHFLYVFLLLYTMLLAICHFDSFFDIWYFFLTLRPYFISQFLYLIQAILCHLQSPPFILGLSG